MSRQLVAKSIRNKAREAAERARNVRRAEVVRLKPLTVDLLDGPEVLRESDDFEVSAGVRIFDATYGITKGDTALLMREGGEWVLFDVIADTKVKRSLVEGDVVDSGGNGGGGEPSGPAGGVLAGTYPNPGFAQDMATQAELNSHEAAKTGVHGFPAMGGGQGLVWDGTDWIATDLATQAELAAHEADTTAVHGIADTAVLETQAGAAAKVSAHEADTTSVHGIANTADVVLRTLVDAKGDLLVGTAADVLARLAVGADGRLLVADSAAASGLAWKASEFASLPFVHGAINLDGTIRDGTGFTCVRNGAGSYTITFTTAFGAAPHVFVTAKTNSRYIRLTAHPTTTAFTVTFDRRGDTTPAQTDTDFEFLAISGISTPMGPVEAWREVGAAGQPAFANGWVNNGGTAATAAFYKDPLGVVRLKGAIKNGTLNADAFVLPAGYRPPGTTTLVVAQSTGTGIGRVNVFASGAIQPVDANTYCYLDGISFRAA